MKFYSSDDDVVLLQDIASANNVISSVVGHIKDLVITAFPENFIKFVHIDTAEPYLNQKQNDLYNTQANKIRYPSMAVSYEVSMDNPVDVKSLFPQSGTNVMMWKDLRSRYECISHDPEGRYGIYVTYDMATINVGFSIATNKFAQATNIAYWLRSRFSDGLFKYYMGRDIDIEMPKTFVKLIGSMLGYFGNNVSDAVNAEDMRKLELFLGSTVSTDRRITLKKDLQTGKDSFFFGNNDNLMVLFTDFNAPSQPIRDNESETEMTIDFKIQTSFHIPNSYMLSMNKKTFVPLMSNEQLATEVKSNGEEYGNGFYHLSVGSPIKLDFKETRYFLDSDGNKKLDSDGNEIVGLNIVHQAYTYDASKTVTELDLSEILKPALLKVHSFALSQNIDISELLYAEIYTRSESSNAASIDYDTLIATFPSALDSDFVINVWLNRNMFDLLSAAMKSDSFFSAKNAKATIDVKYVDDSGSVASKAVRVYSFKSEDEMYSPSLMKSLRVRTVYGIGYIGLVYEGDPNASPFKVCIGYDRYSNPIIRCFELA